jgi:hydrogenase-4 component B
MSFLTSEQLLLSAFGLLIVGALVTAVIARGWRSTGWIAVVFTAGATVALWVLAARVFAGGAQDTRVFAVFHPLGSSLRFHVDKLSAVFLVMTSFIGLAAALYAVEYMKRLHPAACPARYYPFACLLVAAIVGVVTVSDLLFFLIFWELMTLTSWVLVWFEREDEEKVRAAWQYFVIMHTASACMLVAAIVLFRHSGSLAFQDIPPAMSQIAHASPALVHVLVGLFVIAFVTKAGMFPFGAWLPAAHPAAPSPASALFAGGMIKAGIYGIARLLLEFVPVPEVTVVWGGILAVLGTASIFVGTLTALQQDDSKRVLSFHTIGQIGYILLALGAGVFFLHSLPLVAAVALIAGLYHAMNHACFKSLLFLNVGAAQYWTGTRNLNLMGGLGRLMPLTMLTAVIAALSISGIPPLCGFTSKWLIYQSTIFGGLTAPVFLMLCLVAIFSSIATLASFMKVLGSVFLGQLATNGKEVKGDVPLSMTGAQAALAVACVVLGIAPILILGFLYAAVSDVLAPAGLPSFASLFGSNPAAITLSFGAGATGAWNPPIMILGLAVCMVIAYAIHRAAASPSRETAGWYGGEEAEPDEIRYRAHGFCLPFKEVFAKVYPSVPIPRARFLRFLGKVLDFDNWLYNPFVRTGGRMTDRLSRTHSGVPQLYLLWQMAGVIAVLALLFTLVR